MSEKYFDMKFETLPGFHFSAEVEESDLHIDVSIGSDGVVTAGVTTAVMDMSPEKSAELCAALFITGLRGDYKLFTRAVTRMEGQIRKALEAGAGEKR